VAVLDAFPTNMQFRRPKNKKFPGGACPRILHPPPLPSWLLPREDKGVCTISYKNNNNNNNNNNNERIF